MGKLKGLELCLQRVSYIYQSSILPWADLLVIHISTQAYDDYLDDVLSLDLAGEAVSDKPLSSTNMLDFLVKEEPLGEDDLKALQKDRQKKDNHNMSENFCFVYKKTQTISFYEAQIGNNWEL